MALRDYAGTVTKVELKRFDHPDPYVGRYSQNSEYYQFKLLVAIETNEGVFWFYTPPADYCISCPIGCPLAVCIVHENAWIAAVEYDDPIGHTCGTKPEAKLKEGEQLSIRAKVKRENTRYGTQLYYVKRA